MGNLTNLLIGVISGVFSSIIVSVIFYIITREQNRMDEAKNIAYPLYSISLFSSKLIEECEDKIDMRNQLKNALEELDKNFSRYEPWRYYGELKEIMVEIDNFRSEGYAYQSIDDMTKNAIEERTNLLIERLCNYEKNFGKHCVAAIVKSKTIKICALILMVLMIVTIGLFFFQKNL